MKPLPFGLQVFEDIREHNTLYVDKTARILDMITSVAKIFFLSRPRRFGKTLLCSTLQAIFDGRRELFDGLAIGASDWKWEKHPVIRIDMSDGSFSDGAAACRRAIQIQLTLASEQLAVPLRGEDLSSQLRLLITDAHTKYGAKVVVLVDEYDNPLLSVIDKPDEFDAVRRILRDFYKVVKVAEAALRFTFITGITKFSQVSIFSALNNLTDITLDPRFADLCGITQEEMERDFSEYIDQYAAGFGGRDAYISKLRNYYNGYRFTKKPQTVYNPFGLLFHFNSGDFLPYWFESGTPGYLIKVLKAEATDILDLEGATVTLADLRRFELDKLRAVPLLFQAGYLTVTDYNEAFQRYTLDYPNTEVRAAFSEELAENVLCVSNTKKNALFTRLPEWLYNGELDTAFEKGLIPFFAGLPYDVAINEERYFQAVFHVILNMLGVYCRSEVRIADGRIDSLVETPKYVYCFEFKLEKNKSGGAEAALAQIDSKEYLTPWRGTGKTLVKVGVGFDYEKRNIVGWKSVTI